MMDRHKLFAAIKRELPALEQIHGDLANDDGIYKFYSQSFKAFRMQRITERIAAHLQAISDPAPLHPWFMKIVAEGLGHEFDLGMNADWLAHTRKIAEAYLHARYLLDAVIEVGRMTSIDDGLLPSAWFTVSELLNPSGTWT